MFITFEGIDGSGKTTQIKLLKEKLQKQGYSVQVFREPGGTKVSEQVRTLLLSEEYEIDPVAEMLLFSASRAQLTTEKIQPMLQGDTIVILDRFYDSTLAYQGFGRQILQEAEIKRISEIATQDLSPDITFYLKISMEEARKRTKDFAGDRMEQSGQKFYNRVINGYNKIAEQEERIKVVRSSGTVDETHIRIMDIMEPLISCKNQKT